MFGLTPLGLFHTAVSFLALICGFIALVRYKQILLDNRPSQIYLVCTLLAGASALGIFNHGGFNNAHVLAILTLLALAAGIFVSKTSLFGAWQKYLRALCFTTTFLFHTIPGVTELLTRFPMGSPVFPSPLAPELKPIFGGIFLIYLVGLALQLHWLKRHPAA